ncbi:MliC family protein [Vibrio maerlii]|uniref:MliC family protein n=1 Tax=Vibrio maerlii TaxID=2231648 RepID=UPI0013DEA178|nr:MliC family protein [Vibrio maerlii]
MMKRAVTIILGAIVLSGCTKKAFIDSDELPVGLSYTSYQCEGNKGFQIAFDGDEFAYLNSSSKDYRLAKYPAASGMKYILDDGTKPPINGVTFIAKGDDARLEVGNILFRNCTLVN